MLIRTWRRDLLAAVPIACLSVAAAAFAGGGGPGGTGGAGSGVAGGAGGAGGEGGAGGAGGSGGEHQVAPPGADRGDYPIHYDQPASVDEALDFPEGAPETLMRRFMQLHTAMRYEDAAEIALRLADLLPDNPHVHYNVACVMARLNRTQQACDALERAIDLGWRHLRHTLLDTDLQSIRHTDRYAQLIARLSQRLDAEQVHPVPLRTDDWRQIVAELREQTPGLLERYRVPGVSLALVHDGQVVFAEGFGRNDASSEQAMTAEHRFRVHSPMYLFGLLGALHIEDDGGVTIDSLLAFLRDGQPQRHRGVSPAAHRSRVAAWRAENARGSRRVSPSQAMELFELAVELHRDASFAAFCRDELFVPAGMDRTSVLAARDADRPLAIGHTVLGTAIRDVSPRLRARARVQTTAQDMAKLVTHLMAKPEDVSDSQSLQQRILDLADETGGALNFAVYVDSTTYGMRMQIVDEALGMGCLVRWYPESRRGIAVMYNASGGREAAARLAHLALGGEW